MLHNKIMAFFIDQALLHFLFSLDPEEKTVSYQKKSISLKHFCFKDFLLYLKKHQKIDVFLIHLKKTDAYALKTVVVLNRILKGFKIILIIESIENAYDLFEYLKAGVVGLLSYDTLQKELPAAIYYTYHGKRYLDKTMINCLSDASSTAQKPSATASQHHLKRLTPKETEVFFLLIQGLSSKSIAQKLSLHIRTIFSFRASIYKKLQVNTIKALMLFATKNDLMR